MRILMLLALLIVPMTAVATEVGEPPYPYYVPNLRVQAGNQRLDVQWDPAHPGNETAPQVTGYRVLVYAGETPLVVRETNATHATFLVTNGRSYAVQVEPLLSDGTTGPRSYPVAATPALQHDLEYLAAGLCVTWLAIFGYIGFLARREARLDRKLEQLLSHRGGRNP